MKTNGEKEISLSSLDCSDIATPNKNYMSEEEIRNLFS